MRVTALIAGLSITFAGCSHAPDFERQGPRSLVSEPEVRPPARIALVTSSTLDPGFARKIEVALRMKDGVALVASASDAEYIVHVDLERRATTTGTNFLICWPGFVVFAPVWHGLDWPYSLASRVSIERFDGVHVADYELDGRWTAHYTSEPDGLAAEFGWFVPLYTLPAVAVGIETSVGIANTKTLDRTFVLTEGDLWAEDVVATIEAAIACDRRDRGAMGHEE